MRTIAIALACIANLIAVIVMIQTVLECWGDTGETITSALALVGFVIALYLLLGML